MGLDTSHDAWHGSYSGFGNWRHRIAVAAGIIKDGETLYPSSYDERPSPIDWDKWNAMTDCSGKWREEPEDAIWILLAHSDCDGVIKKRHLIPLAERLEALADEVDGAYTYSAYWDEWNGPTRRFVEGLRRAHEADEFVKFH